MKSQRNEFRIKQKRLRIKEKDDAERVARASVRLGVIERDAQEKG
jgi:hypothetical protein